MSKKKITTDYPGLSVRPVTAQQKKEEEERQATDNVILAQRANDFGLGHLQHPQGLNVLEEASNPSSEFNQNMRLAEEARLERLERITRQAEIRQLQQQAETMNATPGNEGRYTVDEYGNIYEYGKKINGGKRRRTRRRSKKSKKRKTKRRKY